MAERWAIPAHRVLRHLNGRLERFSPDSTKTSYLGGRKSSGRGELAGGVDEQGTRGRADVRLAGEGELPAGLDGGGGQLLCDVELAGEDDAGGPLPRLRARAEARGRGPPAPPGRQSRLRGGGGGGEAGGEA